MQSSLLLPKKLPSLLLQKLLETIQIRLQDLHSVHLQIKVKELPFGNKLLRLHPQARAHGRTYQTPKSPQKPLTPAFKDDFQQ
ncbi:hypothetical protein M758_UG250900 [Ceratodon purpureus]|nr:hypothetical protein M758_UG250900 [Ceratodon purpureus]